LVGARVRPGLIFRFCPPAVGAGPGDEPGPERGGNHQRKSVRLGRDNMKIELTAETVGRSEMVRSPGQPEDTEVVELVAQTIKINAQYAAPLVGMDYWISHAKKALAEVERHYRLTPKGE